MLHPTPVPGCWPWCGIDHTEDALGVREHWTSTPDIPLSLEQPVSGFPHPVQPALAADLVAQGEGDPVVYLSDTAAPTWGRALTSAEARRLHDVLGTLLAVTEQSELVAAGRKGGAL